ncbi:hypothetical protein [Biomaibacter acetigenes]|uniref:hypothetical protein n=1 Tax=Biomaibacter acetigenes TaxID=2316383 RepID=UPI0013CF1802|nr:hypothetical protein [Biomaibacter acetigenes]
MTAQGTINNTTFDGSQTGPVCTDACRPTSESGRRIAGEPLWSVVADFRADYITIR